MISILRIEIKYFYVFSLNQKHLLVSEQAFLMRGEELLWNYYRIHFVLTKNSQADKGLRSF